MTRTIVFLMTLMFVLPSDGSSQAVPSLGHRIRIKQVDGTVLTGRLVTLSPETIQLWISSDDLAEVPVARIEVLETSLGRHRKFGKYFALTVVAASVVGGTIYGLTKSPCTETGWFACMFEPESRGEAVAWGLAGGAIIGLPLGVIIGSKVREERWNRGALPAPTEPRLTIRPVIGGRVGFAGSVRVGGL